MATRRRRSPEERIQWVAKWRASGLSGEKFAKRHGLNESTLHRWAQVMGRESRTAAARGAAAFTQVRLSGDGALDGSVIEIGLPGGQVVRVHGNVDAVQLRVVLETLVGC